MHEVSKPSFWNKKKKKKKKKNRENIFKKKCRLLKYLSSRVMSYVFKVFASAESATFANSIGAKKLSGNYCCFFLLSIYLFLFDFQKEHSDTTLRRCIDVEPTLYKRHVPAGNKLIDYNEQCKLN